MFRNHILFLFKDTMTIYEIYEIPNAKIHLSSNLSGFYFKTIDT